jgi:hypothetical protein
MKGTHFSKRTTRRLHQRYSTPYALNKLRALLKESEQAERDNLARYDDMLDGTCGIPDCLHASCHDIRSKAHRQAFDKLFPPDKR